MNLSQYLRDQPSSYVLALSLLATVFFGVLEYTFGGKLIFSGMYVLPVSLAAASTGFFGGCFAALWASVVWAVVVFYTGENSPKELIPYINAGLTFIPLALVAWIFSRVKSAYQLAWEQASRDRVTGLCNNDFFQGSALVLYGQARRRHTPLTMIAIQLHDLPAYERAETVSALEQLLGQVGGLVRRAARRGDLAGRSGADAVAIILPRTAAKGAQMVLRRVNTGLLRLIAKNQLPIHFGLGCAVFGNAPDSFDTVRDEAHRLAAEALADKSDESHLRLKIFE